MAFYTLVNPTGTILAARVWSEDTPIHTEVDYRWLPDNPPPLTQYQSISVNEPVAAESTEIEYTLSDIPLEDAIIVKRDIIDTLRNEKMDAGVVYNANTYDSDATSRLNLTAVISSVNAGIPLPSGFTWRTADNVDISHDATSLIALAAILLGHINACYNTSWTHKDATAVLTTVAAVEAYDNTGGWPV